MIALLGLLTEPQSPLDPRETRWELRDSAEKVLFREIDEGLRSPQGVWLLATPLAGRLTYPARLVAKKGLLDLFVRFDFYTGPRWVRRDEPWDPRYDPRYDTPPTDKQPVFGRTYLFEAHQKRGYASARWSWGWLAVGRLVYRQGPCYRLGLNLTGFSGPFDFYYLTRAEAWNLRATAGFARVPDTVNLRRLAFQRITWQPKDWFYLAATSAVLTARSDWGKYAIPFLFVYDIQRYETRDDLDNLFGSFEGSVRLGAFRLYAEVFADDPTFISGGEATVMGIAGGGALQKGGWELRLEGSAITPGTYAHFSKVNSIQNFGWPMGSWLGPDSRALYAHLSFERGPWRALAFAEAYEHGEMWLGEPPEAWGDTSLAWPTGVVEQVLRPGVELCFSWAWGELGFRASWLKADNFANEEGKEVSEPRLRLFLLVGEGP